MQGGFRLSALYRDPQEEGAGSAREAAAQFSLRGMICCIYPNGQHHTYPESPMSGLSLRDPEVLGTLALAAVCAGGLAAYYALRKRPSPEELERLRRMELVQSGRISDGTVIDISEVDPQESGLPGGMQLILYKYEIGGVEYECSQDVTSLGEYLKLHETQLGIPCSVRYDVHKPENSIVVAEGWSGLRNTMHYVPPPPPRRRFAAGKSRTSPPLL
jgi:hypothetical protein